MIGWTDDTGTFHMSLQGTEIAQIASPLLPHSVFARFYRVAQDHSIYKQGQVVELIDNRLVRVGWERYEHLCREHGITPSPSVLCEDP